MAEGKTVKNVDTARLRYLTIAEAQRLINASEPDFRQLVQAALQTGARYSELARLTVTDFNPDVGTVQILQSKSGKPRHIVLTDEGSAFFKTTHGWPYRRCTDATKGRRFNVENVASASSHGRRG